MRLLSQQEQDKLKITRRCLCVSDSQHVRHLPKCCVVQLFSCLSSCSYGPRRTHGRASSAAVGREGAGEDGGDFGRALRRAALRFEVILKSKYFGIRMLPLKKSSCGRSLRHRGVDEESPKGTHGKNDPGNRLFRQKGDYGEPVQPLTSATSS